MFLGQISEMEILMDLHVLRTTDSKYHTFKTGLCVLIKGSCCAFSTRNNCCEFLASYGVNFQSDTNSYLKTPVFCAQQQIIAETSNLAFYICTTCRCNLKLFYDN